MIKIAKRLVMNIVAGCRKNGVSFMRGTDGELSTKLTETVDPSHSIGSSLESEIRLFG